VNYILLIHAEEEVWTAYDAAQQAATMSRHEQLEKELRAAGQYRGCGGLMPSRSATTLRLKEGERVVTDGPYAETREQFGGYYVVDVRDLDEALAIAARIPTTPNGAIEIRPVADLRLP
jgi:hypothetical protein